MGGFGAAFSGADAMLSDPQTRNRLIKAMMGSDPSATMDEPAENRIADDPARSLSAGTPDVEKGSTGDLENRGSPARIALADEMRQAAQPQAPSHLDQLEQQYGQMQEPQPKPFSLKQKILMSLAAVPTAGLALEPMLDRRRDAQQFEEARYDRNRQNLLAEIEAERRMQEQQDLEDQRDVSAYGRQLESQREQDFRQPPHTIDTDSGPMQWDMNSRNWTPILRGGVPVGPKALPKPDTLDAQYDEAMQAGDTARANRILSEIRQLGQAKQQPQREPRQLAIAPDGTVVELTPGAHVAPGTVTAAQYGPEQTKLQQQGQTAQTTLNSFSRYQASFRNLRPQLTPQDVQALQVLTSHEQVARGFLDKAASGALDTLFGEPLTGYSEKAMGGIMTKDQYDKMSPAGKKMLTDYFNAVIQNFGQMKQMMGSVGRNPMQLQAELNTIPMPYIDPQAADMMFSDKFDDLSARNRNIPGFGQQQQSNLKDQVKNTAPEGTRVRVGNRILTKKNGQWVAQ